MKSLEKSRDSRFETADDFSKALEAIRNSVQPDQTYVLGEKMITLSGAQTLADLPKLPTSASGTFGGAAPTQQMQSAAPPPPVSTQRFGPTGTRAADDEATRIERPPGDAPTVMERLATQAAPTQLEAKMQAAPKEPNKAMLGAIAVAIAVVVAVGGWLITHRQASQPAAPAVPIASTAVTTSAPAPANIPAGQGALLLSASPWGDIDKVVDDRNKQQIALNEDDRSTPTRLDLAPGKYLVTMSGPAGKTTTFDVQVNAGKTTSKAINLGVVNFDELEKEVSKP